MSDILAFLPFKLVVYFFYEMALKRTRIILPYLGSKGKIKGVVENNPHPKKSWVFATNSKELSSFSILWLSNPCICLIKCRGTRVSNRLLPLSPFHCAIIANKEAIKYSRNCAELRGISCNGFTFPSKIQ